MFLSFLPSISSFARAGTFSALVIGLFVGHPPMTTGMAWVCCLGSPACCLLSTPLETGVAHTQNRFKPAGAIYCFLARRKLHTQLHKNFALHSTPQKLHIKLHKSSALSSTKAPHSAPQKLHTQLHQSSTLNVLQQCRRSFSHDD